MSFIKDIASGNELALIDLYSLYKVPVFRFVFSAVKDYQLAEDVTQDTF